MEKSVDADELEYKDAKRIRGKYTKYKNISYIYPCKMADTEFSSQLNSFEPEIRA